jgi:exodeoxyribonuclease V alpha subunit
MLVDLQGQIERVTYTSEESGFTIAKLRVNGHSDLVTVVGNLLGPVPGETLKIRGEWVRHPKYGEQFKVLQYKTAVPASVHGIEKYLASGLIKGIGPVMAKRIVSRFGVKTLELIEEDIGKLSLVEGIGEKRIRMIKRAWDEQKEIRDVMLFLQSHGVSSGFATKIFKQYGDRAIEIVRQNPYRLATDIFGVGFLSADRIAEKLGFAKDCQIRAEAGILYVLQQMAEDGHVFYPYERLLEKSQDILQVDRDVISRASGAIAAEKRITFEDLNRALDEFRQNHKAVYLPKFHAAETGIANLMTRLLNSPKAIRRVDSGKAIAWVQKQLSITLARNQTEAVRSAIANKVMVITGGPGTGKTTIINAILKIFAKLPIKVKLAAPTGRAAKRMTEATGHGAKTIHRMLEYSLQKGGFQRNEKSPLEADLVIIDEASMIDTVLMYHLLRALPPGATFILVGDVNQLPSVGAGNVLGDIIASGAVPVVELNEIFRQARESAIVVSAHKINQGLLPSLGPGSPKNDFYFIEQEEPKEVLRIILELVKTRIPQRFGLQALDDIQVLTPMHKGTLGAENLNIELQGALNPGQEGIVRGNRNLRVSDKVMQIKNNYDKDVFNGDIGRIDRIDLESQVVTVSFEGWKVPYDFSELDEIVLAYAVSVHKSQGSEYPAVVIPVHTQHYLLLRRNLIYTAVTRGKQLVVMVGTKKALAIGIKNDRMERRYTYLRHRLA